MAPVHEFGRRQFKPSPRTAPPQQRRSLMPALGGVIAAFAVGGFAIVAWNNFPAPGPLAPALRTLFASSGPQLDFSGDRIGRASTAPFLKVCLTSDVLDIPAETGITSATLLRILEAGATQARVKRAVGTPGKHVALKLAQTWGQVADCIYRQDSWHLCDIDNRALAVEAGNAFIRQADSIITQPEKAVAAQLGDIQALTATKDRVLETLRHRVRTGVLIAADFSPFAPATIRRTLDETETVGNACAKPKP
jgi:hypothetical protein